MSAKIEDIHANAILEHITLWANHKCERLYAKHSPYTLQLQLTGISALMLLWIILGPFSAYLLTEYAEYRLELSFESSRRVEEILLVAIMLLGYGYLLLVTMVPRIRALHLHKAAERNKKPPAGGFLFGSTLER